MPRSNHSMRYMRNKINEIKRIWLKNRYYPDKESITRLYDEYIDDVCDLPPEEALQKATKFNNTLEDFMVNNLHDTFKMLLDHKKITVDDIDDLIHYQPIDYVRRRLWAFMDIWMITYESSTPKLADIANSDQNVHLLTVHKKTTDGIALLSNYTVPEDQKTLKEIEKAWVKIYPGDDLKHILDDMREWGARKQVMHKTENKYKIVLRGLWAKLKTYDGEIYTELVKRLFEECSESVGLCADGHVGRLVNVLAGFDDDFKSSMGPMEYFQHNMSRIAENTSPLSFKVEQATRLMDEIQMPQDQRAAWLDAF